MLEQKIDNKCNELVNEVTNALQIQSSISKNNILLEDMRLSNAVITLYHKKIWDKAALINYIIKTQYAYKIPRAFSGISIKIEVKKLKKFITAILFQSGKCVIVGVTPTTVSGLPELINEITTILINANCILASQADYTYKISNKVYSFKIAKKDFPGALCDWYNLLPEARRNFEYNPTMFPGATLRVPQCSSVILLFNSCKGIITGGKNTPDYFSKSINYLTQNINILKNRISC